MDFVLFSPDQGSGGTFEGIIRASDPPCESPVMFGFTQANAHNGKPCHRFGPFRQARDGSSAVFLNWELPAANDLDIELWRESGREGYSSNSFGVQDGLIGGEAPGSYEVRVVYLGSTSHQYQLRVAYTWK